MLDHKPRARRRLEEELIIWFTTVTPTGQPQASPVWFGIAGDDVLIYSQPSALRLRNLEANPRVALNLRGDEVGGDVVTLEGVAHVEREALPADQVPEYIEKYRELIASYGWTAESFASDYSVPIRVTPTRVRG